MAKQEGPGDIPGLGLLRTYTILSPLPLPIFFFFFFPQRVKNRIPDNVVTFADCVDIHSVKLKHSLVSVSISSYR